MHSEIRVKADNFKLYLSLGLCATGLIIFLSIWFAAEFSVILLSIAGVISLAGVVGVYGKFLSILHSRQLAKIDIELQRQELRIKTAEADKAELMAGIITFPRTDRALLMSGNDMRLIEAMTGSGNGGVIQPLAAPQAIPELLPILDSAQRVLIIGASDSGKTNLLQWVVSRRTGAIIVIDPHSSPNKWPKSARVVGAGSNHPEIETTLDNLIGVMVQRYKEISAGLVREGEHPKLTIIIDEWMSIAYQCQNAQDVMVRLLTESRKAAMSVIIGSHSERVKSLGLDGKGDLRDGFLFVRLWLESTGERRATYDYGRGERPCVLPGKFANVTEGPVIEIEAITEAKPTEQEQKVLDLKATGASYNEICRQIYGTAGGKQIQLVKDILAKYQVPG